MTLYFNAPSQRTLGNQFVAMSVALALTVRSLAAPKRPWPAIASVRRPMMPINVVLMVSRMAPDPSIFESWQLCFLVVKF